MWAFVVAVSALFRNVDAALIAPGVSRVEDPSKACAQLKKKRVDSLWCRCDEDNGVFTFASKTACSTPERGARCVWQGTDRLGKCLLRSTPSTSLSKERLVKGPAVSMGQVPVMMPSTGKEIADFQSKLHEQRTNHKKLKLHPAFKENKQVRIEMFPL